MSGSLADLYPNAPLLSALSFIHSRPHHYYPSPKIQPKRASVALIIWIKPKSPAPTISNPNIQTLQELFEDEWVQQGEPQVLFIKRAKRASDRWSAHVALPGIIASCPSAC